MNPSPSRSPFLSLLSGAMLLAVLFVFAGMLINSFGKMLGFTHLESIWSGENPGERELHFLRFSQGLTILLGFGVSSWMWALRERERPSEILGLAPVSARNLLLGAASILVILPFATWLYISPDSFTLPEFLKHWEIVAENQEEKTENIIRLMVSDLRWDAMLMNFVVIAVLPGICEELFFRGFLMGTFRRFMGMHAAVWSSAILFSFFHFQFLGFFSRLALGVALGYLAARSGSVRLSILAHFTHNFLQLLILWLLMAYPQEGIDPFAATPVGVSTIAAVFSLLLTLLVLRQVRNENPDSES